MKEQNNMEDTNFRPRTDLTELNNSIKKVKVEIGKIIVGQEQTIEMLIAAVLADGHVLIEGVPGIAKTLLAKLIARTISADFSRIQFTPDLMPSDIIGTSVFNLKNSEFEFNRGPVFSNIILIDEINRAPAKTQSALFEAMEERQVTVDGTTYHLDRPFTVFATQNPIEHEGTYKLPEAQLDRFLFKVEMNYPTAEEELKILLDLHNRKNVNDLSLIEPVFTKDSLKELREKVSTIHIDEKVAGYISQLVTNTRNNSDLYLGGSPRASISIMIGAKSIAAMSGRDFVTPDDIKHIIYSAMRHRILLTPEREMEGRTPDDIIKIILERVEVPR
jgi:MoxR-like ATPase